MASPSKNAILVSLSSKTSSSTQSASNFVTDMNPSLPCDTGKWSVSVASLSVWNTNSNISSALGNNTFSYFNGSLTRNITIPSGIWTFADLTAYISSTITSLGDDNTKLILQTFPPLVTTQWVITAPYTVTIPAGFGRLIGFTPGTYSTSTIGSLQADFTNGVSAYLVQVNVLNSANSYLGSNGSSVLFSYSPSSPPGALSVFQPAYPIFLPVTQRKISSISVKITDQTGREVVLEQPGSVGSNPTSLTLLFTQTEEEK